MYTRLTLREKKTVRVNGVLNEMCPMNSHMCQESNDETANAITMLITLSNTTRNHFLKLAIIR